MKKGFTLIELFLIIFILVAIVAIGLRSKENPELETEIGWQQNAR